MPAYGLRMSVGEAGAITRLGECTLEPILFGDTPPAGYGLPVRHDGNAVGTGAAATDICGFTVRPYPTMRLAPQAKTVGDAMRRGYINVKVNAGTPARAGTVYVRIAAPTADKPLGGIEAASDGANTLAIPGAEFKGEAVGDITEISYNL